MKAISTRFLPATNFRESRIKATAEGGNSITIGYPHEEDSGEPAHRVAALALQRKMGWPGTLIGGGTETGWCFVFLPREMEAALKAATSHGEAANPA